MDDAPDVEEESPAWARVGIVLALMVGAVVILLLTSDMGDFAAYSKPVDEVVSNLDDYRGRQLRVEGDLRQGSVTFREQPCEWRFVIEKGGEDMTVSFPQCVVPDTFRDDFGIIVTARGHVQDDGSFLANELIPKCPMRYEEMEGPIESGEAMPALDLSTIPAPEPS